MPQIHYGMFARSAAFSVDFCWNGSNWERQDKAARILAERVVEPYWRLVSLPPFMAFHHLRSRNQGSNALGGALVGAIVLGDSHPDASPWFGSLFQTFMGIVAHDIGWAGTNLESGLPGYRDVSTSSLYTAAACLSNARGSRPCRNLGSATAPSRPWARRSVVRRNGSSRWRCHWKTMRPARRSRPRKRAHPANAGRRQTRSSRFLGVNFGC
jgi:hypothetical protein